MRARTWGVTGLVMAAALLGQVSTAWAQGGGTSPSPPPGQPAANPTGPSLTVTADGTPVSGPTGSAPGPAPDEASTAQTLGLPPKTAPATPKPLLWAGSVLFFDQSINSEAIGVGRDYQSRNPSYQLWFSIRPRINLITKPKDKLSLIGRLDATKELTNGDDTAEYRQTTLGDAWLNLTYSHVFVKRNGWSTTLSTGPRLILPTSLASQGASVYLTAGGGAGILQTIPLNRGSEWFSSARLLGSAYYTHAFSNSTTAVNDAVFEGRPRYSTNPNISNINNQLSGGLLAEHQVLSVLDTGIQITPKLGLTVDTIFIQRWGYKATDTSVMVQGQPVPVQSGVNNADPQRYRLSVYFLASVDYQLTDELNLSLNYYNFANTIGPSGTRQSMFYTPDGARFSFTVTVGLDDLYDRIVGKDAPGGNAAAGGRVASSSKLTSASF